MLHPLPSPTSPAPPAVLAADVAGSIPCSGCGAALKSIRYAASDFGSSVDYRDALCGMYPDSIHRLPLDA